MNTKICNGKRDPGVWELGKQTMWSHSKEVYIHYLGMYCAVFVSSVLHYVVIDPPRSLIITNPNPLPPDSWSFCYVLVYMDCHSTQRTSKSGVILSLSLSLLAKARDTVH